MIGKKIQNFILKEIKAFSETYRESQELDEKFLEDLLKHFSEEAQKPKAKKDISADNRCVAVTSKKTQCSAKRFEENNMCSIHHKKGAKFGTIHDLLTEDENETEKEEKIETQRKCKHVFTKGKMQGTMCNANLSDNGFLCKKHKPRAQPEELAEPAEIPAQDTEIIPEDSYEEKQEQEPESEQEPGSEEDHNSDDN